MKPQSVATACNEGPYERAHRSGLLHALNALNAEVARAESEPASQSPSLVDLLDALQDRLGPASGRLLSASPIRGAGEDIHALQQENAEAANLIAEMRSTLECWLRSNAPGGWIDKLRTDHAALLAIVTRFTERCDEIRNGSPNAFYSHVDAFCKSVRAELEKRP